VKVTEWLLRVEVATAAAEAILPDQNRSRNWSLFVAAQEILFVSFSFGGQKLGKRNGGDSPETKCSFSSYSKGKGVSFILLWCNNA